MFHNRKSEFSERRIIVATNPHFSYSICRPEKRSADSRMTETLKSSCPTQNINHMPVIIEDVSETEDTKTPEINTNHLTDQYADKYANNSDLIIEDV